jgi:hypothetical protein
MCDTSNSAAWRHCVVLGHHAGGVLHRHGVAGEGHHAGAEFDMQVVQRGTLQQGSWEAVMGDPRAATR